MDFLTKEESYADRRQLFKNIWDTAMHIDEKDTEVINKPKVIKTLRLDEVDRCVVGKSKKQRIKNLRTVCNKILEFCDRQDADDVFYEQMVAEGRPPQHNMEIQPKKPKVSKTKKKQTIKANSMFSPLNKQTQAKATTSEHKTDLMGKSAAMAARNNSPSNFNRTTTVRKSHIRNQKSLTSKTSPRTRKLETNKVSRDIVETDHRKKVSQRNVR